MKNILLSAALLTATATASDFSYTNLDLGYLNGNAELPSFALPAGFDNDLDVEGFFVAGRYEITNNFFAYASFEDGEVESDLLGGAFDVDTRRLEAGLGAYASIASCADVYFTVGYKYSELELDGLGEQEIGNIDVNLGIRWAPATWIEINPYIEHSFGVEDDDFVGAVDTTTAGLNVYVTAFQYVQPFVGISYELDTDNESIVQDLTLYSAGIRIAF